jgi:hypothetical protein
LFFFADACSSRSTPTPRPPTPPATSIRPNITFQTYACPPAYAAWYCLNGATCFTVKIGESLLYNCEWVSCDAIFHHVLLVYLSINHYLARFSGWQLIVWNFCPVFSPGALTGTWANDANTRISMALICVSCFHCFLNHKYILCFSTRYSTHRFCFWPQRNYSISLFRWNIIMLKSFSYSYC